MISSTLYRENKKFTLGGRIILELVFKIAVCSLLLAVCYFDYRTYRIPNKISLILICLFPIAFVVGGLPVVSAIFPNLEISAIVQNALLAFIVVTAITLPQYILGWMGGGDFKVIMTSSLWVGFHNLQYATFCMALSGGMLAVIYIVLRKQKYLSEVSFLKPVFAKTRGVPYGIAISAGVIPTVLGIFN